MRFAKVFGGDEDQVVVLRKDGDTGPEVRIMHNPPGFGVCEFALGFAKDGVSEDDAEKHADDFFESLEEVAARSMIDKAMSKFMEHGIDDE